MTRLAVNQPVRVIDDEARRIVVEGQSLRITLPRRLAEYFTPRPHEHHGGSN
jgi:hypothetical protein